jgi:hypothetical protein
MTPIFVVLTILFFLGADVIVQKYRTYKQNQLASKPNIFYHDRSFIPTPTMADGGEPINKTKEKES